MNKLHQIGYQENGAGHINYLFSVEYLTKHDGQIESTMEYGGKLAETLDLINKPVTKEVMTHLGEGFGPDGVLKLCKNAGAKPTRKIKTREDGSVSINLKTGEPHIILEGGHRIGFELITSPPKGFSLLYAAASLEQKGPLYECLKIANHAQLEYLQGRAETREGKGGKDVLPVKGLIWSSHYHLASRDLDPQLHVHNLIYGVCETEKGEFRTFDSNELFRQQYAADKIFLATLYYEVQKLGYRIEQHRELGISGKETGELITRIAGITPEAEKVFSKRREELLSYAEEHKVDNQTACLATRKFKDEPNYTELIKYWEEELNKLPEEHKINVQDIREGQDKLVPIRPDDQILEQLHKTNAIFTDHELLTVLTMEYTGRATMNELPKLVEDFKVRNNLAPIRSVAIADEDRSDKNLLARVHSETRWAAQFMVNIEQEVRNQASDRAGETHHHVKSEVLVRILEENFQKNGFRPTEEQNRVFEHVLMKTGGICAIEGFAGTGKTYTVKTYKAAFEAEGYKLHGVCTQNKAARKLEEESGIESMSIARMVSEHRKGLIKFNNKDVIVLDEAGMVDSRSMYELMNIASKAGAKLILQGDTRQLAPVGAGSGMDLAMDEIGQARLTEVRRQTNDNDRAITYLLYGKNQVQEEEEKNKAQSRKDIKERSLPIIAALDKNGCLDEYNLKAEAIEMAAYKYVNSPKESKLMMAHTRAEVAWANDEVRKLLKENKTIGEKDALVKTRQGEKWEEKNFSVGEKIIFGKMVKGWNVVNNDEGTITAIHRSKKGGFNFTVKKADGKTIKFNTQEYNSLNHGYCRTVHAMQGQGASHIIHIAHEGMLDNRSGLVAYTRLTDYKYEMMLTSRERDSLVVRLGYDRFKENATVKEKPEATKKEKTKIMVENLADKDFEFMDSISKSAFFGKKKKGQVNAISQTKKEPSSQAQEQKPQQQRQR